LPILLTGSSDKAQAQVLVLSPTAPPVLKRPILNMLLHCYRSKPLFCHCAKGSVLCFGTAGFNSFEKKEFNVAALRQAAALSKEISSWT